jgi:predicted O-methyltransferase YrrM
MSSAPGWRHDLPGMLYRSFFETYGASFRTKHLASGRGVVDGARRVLHHRDREKRQYPLPKRSKLPAEFIRLDPWEGEYLFMLAQLAGRGIVEVGRFQGGSTFLLSCANRSVPIWSIDLAPKDDDRLRRMFEENQTGDNVQLLIGDSHTESFSTIGEYDLLFIDGDHTRQGCLADLQNFVPRLAPGGHLAVHDCYAEFQVQQAVLDYVDRFPLLAARSPYTINSHWQTSAGSIADFVKPRT